MIMEDLLYGISSLFDGLFSGGGIPTQADNGWALTLMFAAAGALILTRFTGNVGALTIPLNFSALYIGANISNWILQNVKLPVDRTVELPMLVIMAGMTLASFAMLWWLQGDSVRN